MGVLSGTMLQRKPIFSHDKAYTFAQLEIVFQGLCEGADHEQCSVGTMKRWCETLDQCDMEPVEYPSCTDYVQALLRLCDKITSECTGRDFTSWGVVGTALDELATAWRHFVRIIWMRDPEWQQLVAYFSDPRRDASAYDLRDP